MRINVPSKFDRVSTYLQTEIQVVDGDTIDVSEIHSPLNRVNSYYNQYIRSDFDFSFYDEKGLHRIIGKENNHVSNLLILLAYECAIYNRDIIFSFSNGVLNDFLQCEDFLHELLVNTVKTVEQLDQIASEKNDSFWTEFCVWIYFKLCTFQLEDEQNISSISSIIDEMLSCSSPVCFSVLEVIKRIDAEFIASLASKGAYQKLRTLITSTQEGQCFISLLGSFQLPKKVNDPHYSWNNLSIAARRVAEQNKEISELNYSLIEEFFTHVKSTPEPKYLPIIAGNSPEYIAQQILKYYDYSLPSWDMVLSDLGTNLIRYDLGKSLLGIFLNNPDAHQSVIVVNDKYRGKGSHNFTIAHELGHYLLHNSNESFLCANREVYFPEYNQQNELQANAFSVELLMPLQKIREDISGIFSTQNVQNIANKCAVSMEAAARRRVQLEKKRNLAFISILNNRVVSIAATQIKEDGTRWIGRPSVGLNAIPLFEALALFDKKEKRLSRYLSSAVEEWLQDLDIHIHPFRELDGYYIFIERAS